MVVHIKSTEGTGRPLDSSHSVFEWCPGCYEEIMSYINRKPTKPTKEDLTKLIFEYANFSQIDKEATIYLTLHIILEDDSVTHVWEIENPKGEEE